MSEPIAPRWSRQHDFDKDVKVPIGGLTKRELFAAMALQGVAAGSMPLRAEKDLDERTLARMSVMLGDALISVLENSRE